MLTLSLVAMPAARVRGIYTVKGVAGQLPERMRFLHPSAAQMYRAIEEWAVVSDMFRSPESSLAAKRGGRGAMPPGFSGHNYGLSIDLDLDASAARLAALIGRSRVSKAEFDEALRAAGWWCHILEPHGFGAFESWHQNACGIHATPKGKRSSDELEGRILDLYGKDLSPSDSECQAALKFLKLYGGEVDGDVGPLTREATRAFQRTWGIQESGAFDARTRRTLAYVACARSVTSG